MGQVDGMSGVFGAYKKGSSGNSGEWAGGPVAQDILGHVKGGVMGESPFTEISHPKKRAFLAAYSQTGNKSLAAKMAGIVKQTIYTRQWREDPEFQDALERAELMAADILEDEVHRRAVEGVEKPVGGSDGAVGRGGGKGRGGVVAGRKGGRKAESKSKGSNTGRRKGQATAQGKLTKGVSKGQKAGQKAGKKGGKGSGQDAHKVELKGVAKRVALAALEPELFPEIPHPKKRAYVIALAETGNRTEAAKAAGISRWTPYDPQWRDDKALQAALRLADEAAADLMESEAYRRAVTGYDEPAGWYKGEAGGMVRRYSDLLLIFLLKGIRPEKFRDRMEIRGAFAHLDVSQLPDALVARLAKGEHPLSVLAGRRELLEPGDAK